MLLIPPPPKESRWELIVVTKGMRQGKRKTTEKIEMECYDKKSQRENEHAEKVKRSVHAVRFYRMLRAGRVEFGGSAALELHTRLAKI